MVKEIEACLSRRIAYHPSHATTLCTAGRKSRPVTCHPDTAACGRLGIHQRTKWNKLRNKAYSSAGLVLYGRGGEHTKIMIPSDSVFVEALTSDHLLRHLHHDRVCYSLDRGIPRRMREPHSRVEGRMTGSCVRRIGL